MRAKVEARIAPQEVAGRKYKQEKEQIRMGAERVAKDYDAMKTHDDRFDLAEAWLSVAVTQA